MEKQKSRKIGNNLKIPIKKRFIFRMFALSFCLLIVSASLKAQTQTATLRIITGKVVDDSKNPLPGATILLKEKNQAFIASANGEFVVQFPANESLPTLVVSYLGFKTKEVKLTSASPVTVVLEENIGEIGEVVVTGIFNKAKESYTGAATTISSENLKIAGNRSLITSIRNIDPSFNIADNINIGSDPNRLPTITVRGNSSLPVDVKDLQTTADNMRMANQPLIILNGFEVSLSRMMDMDENQIASITLLKDANATAMYGTRGSNGVVVITTKTPQTGRLQLTYKGNLNIEAPDFTSYNLMNAREKLEYEKAAGLYDSKDPLSERLLRDLYNQRKIDAERGVDTYWLKYPVRTGVGSRHSLNLEGGDNNFRYAANLSYNNIAGVMKGSERNTFNGNMLFIYKVKSLTFKNNLEITNNKGVNSPYGAFSSYGKINSYWTPYDAEGNIQKILEEYNFGNLGLDVDRSWNVAYNPLYNAYLPSKKTSEYTQILNNFSIEWYITPALFLRGQLGVSSLKNRSDEYISADNTKFDGYGEDDFGRKGTYKYGSGNEIRYEGQVTLNYSKTFNDVHQVFAGLGGTLTEETGESYSVLGEGISLLSMDFLGMAKQYEKNGRPYGSESIFRTAGALVNASYIYDRRYFIDMNGKCEGSSKFGASQRFAPFWSAGLGWNIYNEHFLKDNPAINVARLRLSYGITGSQAFAPYLANTSYKDFGGESYQLGYGAYLMALGNKDLGWQKTKQYNIGFEGEFFKNRFYLSVDAYNKLTENLLADVNLPPAIGFLSYKSNVGEVENKGVEATMNAFIAKNRQSAFSWSVGATMAYNRNTIKKISNSLEAMNKDIINQSYSSINPSFLYKEGESINTIYVVRSKGIDPGNGKEIFIKADGSETYIWDSKDLVSCGKTDPKMTGSFNTVVRYKGINLSAYFSYRWGGQVYNDALASKVENILPYNNADKRALYGRWKNPGDVVLFKSVKDFSTTKATSRFVMNDNTFTFQTVSLGYDFPSKWTKKNLHTEYLSVKGYLEDILYFSTIKRERGLDYPFSRKFSVSLTARF